MKWPDVSEYKRRELHKFYLRTVLCSLEYSKNGENPPIVLQIGANDGVLADPVKDFFENNSWSGHLFEPHPLYFKEVSGKYEARSDISVHNFAVSDQQGAMELYHIDEAHKHLYPRWIRGCASLDRSRMAQSLELAANNRQKVFDTNHISSSVVDVVDFETAFTMTGLSHFDLLLIDVEGHEDTILGGIDLTRHRPSLIVCEANSGDEAKEACCASIFSNNGYKVIKIGDELIAMKGDNLNIPADVFLEQFGFARY